MIDDNHSLNQKDVENTIYFILISNCKVNVWYIYFYKEKIILPTNLITIFNVIWIIPALYRLLLITIFSILSSKLN